MTLRRQTGAAALLVSLAAALAWAGVSPQPFRTGLFGVTAGQTIRVSVLNAGHARGIITPCVKIWDMEGNLLFESDGQPVSKGTGTFVDFSPVPEDGLPAGRNPGSRIQVRAEVELEPATSDGAPIPDDGKGGARIRPADVDVTLEVIDPDTGKTAFTMPFTEVKTPAPGRVP